MAVVVMVTDVFGSDIAVLKTYGAAPYANALKKLEKDIKDKQNSVNEKIGVKVIIILPATPTPLDPPELTLTRASGIRHRSCTSTSLGCRRRPTTDGRRAALASSSLHKDYSG
jgi:hypothetical protein